MTSDSFDDNHDDDRRRHLDGRLRPILPFTAPGRSWRCGDSAFELGGAVQLVFIRRLWSRGSVINGNHESLIQRNLLVDN
jgi:hypothetical protein